MQKKSSSFDKYVHLGRPLNLDIFSRNFTDVFANHGEIHTLDEHLLDLKGGGNR